MGKYSAAIGKEIPNIQVVDIDTQEKKHLYDYIQSDKPTVLDIWYASIRLFLIITTFNFL